MKTISPVGIVQTPKRLRVPGDFPTVGEMFYELMITLNRLSHVPEKIIKEFAGHSPHKTERL